MEYMYWAISWLCHRKCVHCYEDRFRPYYGSDLARVVDQAIACFPKVIENLPDRITYFDINDPDPDGRLIEKRGRIGISGGEVLTDRVIDELLEHHVGRITVSGLDDYHEGFEGQQAQERQRKKLTKMFEAHGMRHWEWIQAQGRPSPDSRMKSGPAFSFFGATPGW